jgi:exonuclease III
VTVSAASCTFVKKTNARHAHTRKRTHECADATCCRFGADELRDVDAEGRVVITEHSNIVLFNVYGPAITSEESAEQRSAFKLLFYKVGCSPCKASRHGMHSNGLPFPPVKQCTSLYYKAQH